MTEACRDDRHDLSHSEEDGEMAFYTTSIVVLGSSTENLTPTVWSDPIRGITATPYRYYPPPMHPHHSTPHSVLRDTLSTSAVLTHPPASPNGSSSSPPYVSNSDLEDSQQVSTSPDAIISTQGANQDNIYDIIHKEDSSPINLPFITNLRQAMTDTWQLPNHPHPTTICLEVMYKVQEKDIPFLLKHPQLNSIVIESLQGRQTMEHLTSADKQGQKIDMMSRRIYATMGLDLRILNYKATMAQYQFFLWQKIEFLTAFLLDQLKGTGLLLHQGDNAAFQTTTEHDHDKGTPISILRLSKWIIEMIELAYRLSKLDLCVTPKGHSTRAVTASSALRAGIALQDTCKAATWSTPCTFTKQYLLDARQDCSFGHAVLSTVLKITFGLLQMTVFLSEMHVWSLKTTLCVEDKDIGIYHYYDKKEPDTQVNFGYLCQKQQLAESRDYPWVLKNKRPEKLRDTLKELEELMQNSQCVLSRWKNKYVCQLLFHSGVLVSLSLSGPQLERVVIDRTLMGKLISNTISDATPPPRPSADGATLLEGKHSSKSPHKQKMKRKHNRSDKSSGHKKPKKNKADKMAHKAKKTSQPRHRDLGSSTPLVLMAALVPTPTGPALQLVMQVPVTGRSLHLDLVRTSGGCHAGINFQLRDPGLSTDGSSDGMLTHTAAFT
ncbi:hypothetical protein EYD10_05183 [Varanus komodoensis]|nr:hypothetical protein EYD10_05183 [Varanus komodoensis]